MHAELNRSGTIVLAENDLDSRTYLQTALVAQGYAVHVVEDGQDALRFIEQQNGEASLLLMDIAAPRMGGLEVLSEVRKVQRELPVIVYSGQASSGEVDQIVERGWARFIEKPVHHKRLIREIESLIREKGSPIAADPLPWTQFVENPYMKRMDGMLRQVAASEFPILLQGETGVGKEVMARQIHAYSNRRNEPFVKVNCAALPSELVESELFGYERGAFTGAVKDRPGLFEIAEGGTILLDEIGDMDFKLQAKLLQVLQDGEFHRLGCGDLIRVDVRVMAATHQDLKQAIAERRFREDLYYRLNVLSIQIPPVRERKGEIPCLAHSLLEKHATSLHPYLPVTPQLEAAMMEYDWPGNIRELENTMRRYLVIRNPEYLIGELRNLGGGSVRAEAAPKAEPFLVQKPMSQAISGSALKEAERSKREAEKNAVLSALEATRWSRKQAAAMLNIDYKAFLYKMKKLGIASAPATPIA